MNWPDASTRGATATLPPIGGSGEWETPPGLAVDPEAPGLEIEDWIVDALDGRERPYLPARRAEPAVGTPMAAPGRGPEGEDEARFEESLLVERDHGIALVSLTDRTILGEAVIHRIAAELSALLDGGDARIVLDYLMVHRMSSRFLATVAKVHRRCAAAGGWLKICGLRRESALAGEEPALGPGLGRRRGPRRAWSGPRSPHSRSPRSSSPRSTPPGPQLWRGHRPAGTDRIDAEALARIAERGSGNLNNLAKTPAIRSHEGWR